MGNALTRRNFVKTASVATAGLAFGAVPKIDAKSYNRILGSNDRVNCAVIGVRNRGMEHIQSLCACSNARVTHLCDVDSRYLEQAAAYVKELSGENPGQEKDIRKLLEVKDIDVITIATPEHWHTPMAIMGLKTGKHVYVEKPPSHNPAEGALLINAQKKYGFLVQMGNQQRSSPHTIEAIQKIHDGIIGTPYAGKGWYSNNRQSIGIGKKTAVPDYLDWELWQGPAPRKPFKDNIHPYNWHWFWNWGTGETLNNGTHEVDMCLWALNAGYPNKVSAAGGRYHFKDDWEFYDTLVTNFEYDDKLITWEGMSCNNMSQYNRGRGVTIHGTKGTVLIDRNGYEVHNNNKEVVFSLFQKQDVSMGIGGGGPTTDSHFQNLINAILKGENLHSPIEEGNVSVTMLQLSNIAWKTGKVLDLNPENGRILNDDKAMDSLWCREYEPGWELKI
jgi:predicted dehydrogenase